MLQEHRSVLLEMKLIILFSANGKFNTQEVIFMLFHLAYDLENRCKNIHIYFRSSLILTIFNFFNFLVMAYIYGLDSASVTLNIILRKEVLWLLAKWLNVVSCWTILNPIISWFPFFYNMNAMTSLFIFETFTEVKVGVFIYLFIF